MRHVTGSIYLSSIYICNNDTCCLTNEPKAIGQSVTRIVVQGSVLCMLPRRQHKEQTLQPCQALSKHLCSSKHPSHHPRTASDASFSWKETGNQPPERNAQLQSDTRNESMALKSRLCRWWEGQPVKQCDTRYGRICLSKLLHPASRETWPLAMTITPPREQAKACGPHFEDAMSGRCCAISETVFTFSAV